MSAFTFNKNLARLSLEQGKGEILSPIRHYKESRADFFWLLFQVFILPSLTCTRWRQQNFPLLF